MFAMRPMGEEVLVHRVKPKKRGPKLVLDVDVPMHGNFHLHDHRRHGDHHKHADHHRHAGNHKHVHFHKDAGHNKHVRFHRHVAMPCVSPVDLPLTPGLRAPKKPAPRLDHHHHHRAANPFFPDPPKCSVRHCAHSRIAGSRYCQNDTCRDPSCSHRSHSWGGFCEDHGCATAKCRRRRAVIEVPAGRCGPEHFIGSDFCGVHSCRKGCGRAGEIEGFCVKHYKGLYY